MENSVLENADENEKVRHLRELIAKALPSQFEVVSIRDATETGSLEAVVRISSKWVKSAEQGAS